MQTIKKMAATRKGAAKAILSSDSTSAGTGLQATSTEVR